MKSQKNSFVIIALIISSILLAKTAYAGLPIWLEKDVPISQLYSIPGDVMFIIYESEAAKTPIAQQSFSIGEFSVEYVFPALTEFDEISVRLKVDFTHTETLTTDMEFWLEVRLNNVIIGNREQVKKQAQALFAQQADYATIADYAQDADTVDGAHASDLEESAEIHTNIASHTAIPDAHHAKTTSFSELTDLATDAQIPNDITIDYAATAGNAMTAANADTVDGKDASEFIDTSNHIQTKSGGMNIRGKLGVGMINPVVQLHVEYGGDNSVGIRLQGDGNDNGLDMRAGGPNGGAGSIQARNPDFSTTGTLALNPDGGNVGIGTMSPTQKLDVAGYIRGQSGVCIGSECRESWSDTPLVSVKEIFVAGHEYPHGQVDPYLRDSKYAYPYLTLARALDLFGIDPNDPYATHWFPIGYSYWQPHSQNSCALFIEEGDNSKPLHLYSKEGTDGDWGKDSPNDAFFSGSYVDMNGITRSSASEGALDQCIATPGSQIDDYTCDHVLDKTYADSTSNIKGVVKLQIRLKAWWEQGGLCEQDYLPSLEFISWGDPRVINLKMAPYQLPDITADPCYGLNIHSKIEARFKVCEYKACGPDPIQNFYDAGADVTYVIRSLGVSYLRKP